MTHRKYGIALVGVVALGVLILGLFAGWWAAKELELKNDQVRVSRSTGLEQGAKVSKQFWGNVCDNQVSTAFAPLDGDIAGQATSAVDQTGKHSQCSVIITNKKKFKRKVLCAIKVHEDGHLAGKGHSDDPNNIMYFKITDKNIPAGCFDPSKKGG